jgi:hypothetical protein
MGRPKNAIKNKIPATFFIKPLPPLDSCELRIDLSVFGSASSQMQASRNSLARSAT